MSSPCKVTTDFTPLPPYPDWLILGRDVCAVHKFGFFFSLSRGSLHFRGIGSEDPHWRDRNLGKNVTHTFSEHNILFYWDDLILYVTF